MSVNGTSQSGNLCWCHVELTLVGCSWQCRGSLLLLQCQLLSGQLLGSVLGRSQLLHVELLSFTQQFLPLVFQLQHRTPANCQQVQLTTTGQTILCPSSKIFVHLKRKLSC